MIAANDLPEHGGIIGENVEARRFRLASSRPDRGHIHDVGPVTPD